MSKPRATITVLTGPEKDRKYTMRAGQRFIIGRAFDCVIRVTDTSISRQHTSLELSANGLIVCDLASRNGTALNSQSLESHKPLVTSSSESYLTVGNCSFTLELTGIDKARTVPETRRIPRFHFPLEEDYELLGEIGRGAAGVVYGARQKALQRNVAIKVPRIDVENYQECLVRFLREGQLCSRINSPHVIAIYDMLVRNESVYIVMELINGGSVRDKMVNETLSIAEIARIGEDVASGLMAIHREGIIHRDLKPANILLMPDGNAKLADFGIAKLLNSGTEEIPLTGSDEGIGTLGFVSPEGASCEPLTPRSDIYSLGATLYRMLTNQVPFVRRYDTLADTLKKILLYPPDPIEDYRSDCPPELSKLVASMMAKDPEDRPADAATVAAQLERIKIRAQSQQDCNIRIAPPTDGFSRDEFQSWQAESTTDNLFD